MGQERMAPPIEPVNQPDPVSPATSRELRAVASLLFHAGRTIESTIEGSSMEGTLPPGTRVRVRRVDLTPPVPGDVVMVAVDGALFAHRVVARGWGPRARAYIVTRGDAMLLCDEPTPLSRTVGVIFECHDGRGWRSLPPPRPGAARHRWIAAWHRLTMMLLLEIDPRLARRFAALSFRVARASPP